MNEKYGILYLHTKGVTTPDNLCIDDWRQYMTYFNVNQYQKCFDMLDEYDSCGVDLVSEPATHYSGNFWWANSSYIKQLPTIDEIKFPKIPPILSIRHNCEFWIGMGNGKLKSLWNSYINVYEVFAINPLIVTIPSLALHTLGSVPDTTHEGLLFIARSSGTVL